MPPKLPGGLHYIWPLGPLGPGIGWILTILKIVNETSRALMIHHTRLWDFTCIYDPSKSSWSFFDPTILHDPLRFATVQMATLQYIPNHQAIFGACYDEATRLGVITPQAFLRTGLTRIAREWRISEYLITYYPILLKKFFRNALRANPRPPGSWFFILYI